jgi:hypothetical protein
VAEVAVAAGEVTCSMKRYCEPRAGLDRGCRRAGRSSVGASKDGLRKISIAPLAAELLKTGTSSRLCTAPTLLTGS